MRHQQTMCGVLAIGVALTACSGSTESMDEDATNESGEGSASDDGDQGSDYSGGNNGSGMDTDDDGALVEPTYPTAHPRIYINAHKARLQSVAFDRNDTGATLTLGGSTFTLAKGVDELAE